MRILALGVLLFGGAYASTYPLQVQDDFGKTITIQAQPKRVVSMLPSNTEMICAIGACSTLVGVDSYSNYPPETKNIAKMGDLFNPNIEAIVAAKPDLVLLSQYGKLKEPLEKAGLTVLVLDPNSYSEIFSKTTVLGKVFNKEAQAKTLNQNIKAKVKKIELQVQALPKPTVYFEVDPTPYAVGQNSFMGTLISKAGGKNIIPAELGDFPQINPELVIEKNPQVILGISLSDAKNRAGWQNIAALKTSKVLEIPSSLNDMLVRPGPRIAEGLQGLAKLLHPRLK